jgi:hypothetical protein
MLEVLKNYSGKIEEKKKIAESGKTFPIKKLLLILDMCTNGE